MYNNNKIITYTLTLDNSPKAKLFVELLKDMAFVKAVEPFVKAKSKKEKIDFDNIDTTELLMKDKKLVKTIENHKAGKTMKSISFSEEEFDNYTKMLLANSIK